MRSDRRTLLGGAAAICAGALAPAALGQTARFVPPRGPRVRVMFVNDLSGDVDGLFAAVHAILSPTIDLRGIVGTAAVSRHETAAASVELANEMLRLTGRAGKVPVHAGAAGKLKAPATPIPSPGTDAILAEARRTDSTLPLYVAVGGGLTEVASALMIDPSIASRMTLIWIGGESHPAGGRDEYNFSIDPLAAQHVFNESAVPLWQVPRDVYATCLASFAEIEAEVAPHGRAGAWLYERLVASARRFGEMGMNTGETWTLGDSPLVLLAALADWVPSGYGKTPRYERTGSSLFTEMARPTLDRQGFYRPREGGGTIRVYRGVDTRMMLADFYAKLRLDARR